MLSDPPRKRSNLTLSLTQHPQHYTQLPFHMTGLGETPLSHHTRLITSAPRRPRSGRTPPHVPCATGTGPAQARLRTEECLASPSSADANIHRTSSGAAVGQHSPTPRMAGLDCLKPRPLVRPHSANHQWVFLTQETLHPTFASSKRQGSRDVDSSPDAPAVPPQRQVAAPLSSTGDALVCSSAGPSASSAVRGRGTSPSEVTSAPASRKACGDSRTSMRTVRADEDPVVAARGGGWVRASLSCTVPSVGVEAAFNVEACDAVDLRAASPPAHLLQTLSRAVHQGEGLDLKAPFAMSVVNAAESTTTKTHTAPREEDVSCAGTTAHAATAVEKDHVDGSEQQNGALVKAGTLGTVPVRTSPLSPRPSHRQSVKTSSSLPPPTQSVAEQVAELWSLATLQRPLASAPRHAQRQAPTVASGLLVEDVTDPCGHKRHQRSSRDLRGEARSAVADASVPTSALPSPPSAVWTPDEYAEAHTQYRRVYRHLPAVHRSMLALRLTEREQWCAQTLHEYHPILPKKKAEDAPTNTATSTAMSTNGPANASANVAGLARRSPATVGLTPPTWIPSRPPSRTASTGSTRTPLPLLVASSSTSRPSGGVERTNDKYRSDWAARTETPAEPAAAARVPPPVQSGKAVSDSASDAEEASAAVTEQPVSSLSPTVSGESWLPATSCYARSAALPSRVPPASAAAVMDDAVLSELPAPYALILGRAVTERQVHYERNRSLYDSAALELVASLVEETTDPQAHTSSQSARSNSVKLVPWTPSPPPPHALPSTARQRGSLPFSTESEIPTETLRCFQEEASLRGSGDDSEGPSTLAAPAHVPHPRPSLLAPSGPREQGARPSNTCVRPSVRVVTSEADGDEPLARRHSRLRSDVNHIADRNEKMDDRNKISERGDTHQTSTGSAPNGHAPSSSVGLRADQLASMSQSAKAPNTVDGVLVCQPGDDDNLSEGSEIAAQHRAEADASIAVYRAQLHDAIIGTNTATDTAANPLADRSGALTEMRASSTIPTSSLPSVTATTTAERGGEGTSLPAIVTPVVSGADGHAVLDFTAQSRLNHLAARVQGRLAQTAEVHQYTNPVDRRRLLALADAFTVQRLQQIVPRLHPVAEADVSELDPVRLRAQKRRDEEAAAAAMMLKNTQRGLHRAGRRTSLSAFADSRSCGGVLPLTEAWRRADARALAMDMLLLDLKRDGGSDENGLERRKPRTPAGMISTINAAPIPTDGQPFSGTSSGSSASSRVSSRGRSRPQAEKCVYAVHGAQATPGRLSVFVGSSYLNDPAVSKLLKAHQTAVVQAEQLQEAMEKSLSDILCQGDVLHQ